MGLIHFTVADLLSGGCDGDEVGAKMWSELQCKGDGQGRVLMPERERKTDVSAGVNTSAWCGRSDSEKLNRSGENGNEKGDREM